MDDEELPGESGGADLGANGVYGGCVDRAGAEEDEEDGDGEAGDGEGFGAEEADECGWNGEGGADGGNEVEGLRGLARPALGDDASGDCTAEASDYCDGSHEECCGGLGAAFDALEEGGHPPGDASEGEGDRGVSEDGGEVCLVPDEGEDGSLLQLCL